MIFAHSKPTRRRRRQALALGFWVAMVVGASCVFVQGQEKLAVTPSFNPDSPQTPETAIEFRLSRALLPAEGRLAILIGRSDVTSFFVVDGARMVYSPTLLPLPLGESQLTFHLVGNDNRWTELQS